MTTIYWGLCFAKVLLCYVFILFIWPSVVFRKFLRNKSLIFRFSFCSATQVVLINTAVLMLGLVHLLNPWVVNILFYGTFLFSIRGLFMPRLSHWRSLRKIVGGTLKWRQVSLVQWKRFTSWLRNLLGGLWRQLRPHLLEYIMLTAIVIYGIVYFSFSPLLNHSYGFGDMYTHHSWIYGLVQGQIFSGNVYPEAMHCVVYLMHTVSGLSVYNCNLFLGCINIFVYLLSAYCLMREIFRWRGTPLLVLTFFLVFAAKCSDLMISLARLQRSLPGEYGLYCQFLCALFLLRFLKEEHEKDWHKNPKAWLKNENLIVFSMALAASIAIHFYVVITAFFICLPFAIVYIRRVFNKERFLPLVAAVMCGVFVSTAPMIGALISGIPFQGSINWALLVMKGEDPETLQAKKALEKAEQVETQAPEALMGEQTPGALEIEQAPEAVSRPSLAERMENMWSTINSKARTLRRGYYTLFGSANVGTAMINLSLLIAAFCLVFRLICMLLPPLRKASGFFDSYLPIIIASFFIMVLYRSPDLDLPSLIEYMRLPSTVYILLLMVAAMAIDIPFSIMQQLGPNWLQQTAALACMIAVCVFTVKTGNYHGYFYNELTRYRSVVNVTSSIIESFPRYTYTIVASTDDLYPVIQYGRHEELLKFLQKAQKEPGYYLPTEYVFVYVEKNPIKHAQYHFSSGPDWLATDVYADTNSFPSGASKFPEVFSTQISEEDAKWSVVGFPVAYSSYKNSSRRTIINSNAYKWCQDFADLHDHEMKVYYEDEDFICYYFRQNTYSLYDLAIWS